VARTNQTAGLGGSNRARRNADRYCIGSLAAYPAGLDPAPRLQFAGSGVTAFTPGSETPAHFVVQATLSGVPDRHGLGSSIAYVIETTPSVITVSGYPPIVALTIKRSGDVVLRVQSGAFTIQQTHTAGTARPVVYRTVWCARCRRLVPGANATDNRLGFRGYCSSCVQELGRKCVARWGRLPHAGEFFCPPCSTILPIEAMTALERDGRRRLRCKPCRKAQLKNARLRRQRR
jgi:hypothetical protein